MHTVIIKNERSSLLFQDFKNLFLPYVESGQISFCDWNESGTDVDSSVPGLYASISGKKEWRALIVLHPEDFEDQNGKIIFDEKNPYDYEVNFEKDGPMTEESPIPLVRLTNMLGGLPPLGVRSVEEVVAEEESDVKSVYVAEEYDEEIQRKYKTLQKVYQFKGIPPAEIVLVTTRRRSPDKTKLELKQVWKHNYESESSRFWERNGYPDLCRFVCFDMNRIDETSFEKEKFGFWMVVLTLAINQIPPSSLQAYRLYKMNVDISEEELTKNLNYYYERLCSANRSVARGISKIPETSFGEEEQILTPQQMPAIIDAFYEGKLMVHPEKIGLSKDCPQYEQYFWTRETGAAKKNLEEFLKQPRRSVDKAAFLTRSKTESFRDKEYDLDKFQVEDLHEMMEDLEAEIIHADIRHRLDFKRFKKELEEPEKEVYKEISTRMTRGKTILVGVLAILFFGIGFLPGIQAGLKERAGGKMFLLAFLVMLLLSVASVGILFWFRRHLKRKMVEFNNIMLDIQFRVNESAEVFEHYFTSVCTFMKAKSIDRGVKLSRRSTSSTKNLLRAHNLAIGNAIDRIMRWSAAFHIQIMGDTLMGDEGYFNYEILPEKNDLYRLRMEESFMMLGYTGDKLEAPYNFVTRAWIDREEIYESKEE